MINSIHLPYHNVNKLIRTSVLIASNFVPSQVLSTGWVELIFSSKCPRPGTKGFALICLWLFVLNLHERSRSRAVLIHARSYTQKNVFWAPSGFGDTILYTKT